MHMSPCRRDTRLCDIEPLHLVTQHAGGQANRAALELQPGRAVNKGHIVPPEICGSTLTSCAPAPPHGGSR